MWTREECSSFFKKVFGLELSDIELESIWTHLSENHFTPVSKHGGNNIGFTPLQFFELINPALERTGLPLEDARFKKVREEILPALIFTLLLKRLGQGEHLIVSSDVPDIALVDFDRGAENHNHRRARALPIEAIFLPENEIHNTTGSSVEEKIADTIIKKKFDKRYVPETILLVSLIARLENLDLKELSGLLLTRIPNPFHQIWIFVGLDANNCAMAMLAPTFEIYRLNFPNDLWPLLY